MPARLTRLDDLVDVDPPVSGRFPYRDTDSAKVKWDAPAKWLRRDYPGSSYVGKQYFTDVGEFGAGVEQYLGTVYGAPHHLIVDGSPASPVTRARPTVKISRVDQVAYTAPPDGSQDNGLGAVAALHVISVGTALSTRSVMAIEAVAKGNSTNAGADVQALNAIARATGGVGFTAIGTYTQGRRDVDTAFTRGLEVQSRNETLTVDAWNAAGNANTQGIAAAAAGLAPSVVAFQTSMAGTAGVVYWLYGFGAGMKGGATTVSESVFYDVTTAKRGLHVVGTKSVAAIAVADLAGPSLFGLETATGDQVGAKAVLFDSVGSNNTFPILWLGSTGSTRPHHVQLRNALGRYRWGVAGGNNDYLQGLVAGDGALLIMDSGAKFGFGGFNGGGTNRKQLWTFTYDAKQAWNGVTPIGPPTVSGSRSGATVTVLAALLAALGAVNGTGLGLIIDNTTA